MFSSMDLKIALFGQFSHRLLLVAARYVLSHGSGSRIRSKIGQMSVYRLLLYAQHMIIINLNFVSKF